MPQIHWNRYRGSIHCYLVQVEGTPGQYDAMADWCRRNVKSDFLQSFGGDYPGVLHRFRFEDAKEAIMFKLIFGGQYGTNRV
jgi:hypothetical protein